jgi:hypothetical protein
MPAPQSAAVLTMSVGDIVVSPLLHLLNLSYSDSKNYFETKELDGLHS